MLGEVCQNMSARRGSPEHEKCCTAPRGEVVLPVCKLSLQVITVPWMCLCDQKHLSLCWFREYEVQ